MWRGTCTQACEQGLVADLQDRVCYGEFAVKETAEGGRGRGVERMRGDKRGTEKETRNGGGGRGVNEYGNLNFDVLNSGHYTNLGKVK